MLETQQAGDASSSEPNGSHHSDSVHNASSHNDIMHSIKTKTYPASIFDAVADSPLFNLPREIRDMIYRFALIHYGLNYRRIGNTITKMPIDITKNNGIPEPGLLLASKIIRYETYEMFYYENIFACRIEYFHPAPVLLAERKFSHWTDRSFGIGWPEVGIDFSERRWNNLVFWLQMCHQDKCIGWDREFQGNEDAEDKMLQGLFDTALESPWYCLDMLNCMLTSMRPAMEAVNSDWEQD
jgi:hypothetical protein